VRLGKGGKKHPHVLTKGKKEVWAWTEKTLPRHPAEPFFQKKGGPKELGRGGGWRILVVKPSRGGREGCKL